MDGASRDRLSAMSADQTAVFIVASEILRVHGGRQEAAWEAAERLAAAQPLRDIFLTGIYELDDEVRRLNEAARLATA